MAAAGLNPFDDDDEEVLMGVAGLIPDGAKGKKVPPEVLEEFDRLMAEGGIDAVVEALKRRDALRQATAEVAKHVKET
jgi:hypothetical protein